MGLYKNPENLAPKQVRKPFNHLTYKDARKIIALANKKLIKYKIHQATGVSKGKIARCLTLAKIIRTKPRINQPWKGAYEIVTYSIKRWKVSKVLYKDNRACTYAQNALPIYQNFIDFCENLYETDLFVNGKLRKVQRSANDFIKQFRESGQQGKAPSKSWVYVMAKSNSYPFRIFRIRWLPSVGKKRRNKPIHERRKPEKYNEIYLRISKELLRKEHGNFEIDSMIGKRTDNQAVLSLMDIASGDYYCALYDRSMQGFAKSLKKVVGDYHLEIKTLTADNGRENNLLHQVVDRSKIFNCWPYYCSGDKGTLENKHRLFRRIIPRQESMNNVSEKDLQKINTFINSYYSQKFNRI